MSNSSSVSVGNWIITFIVSGIPLVGQIMLFVWAFSSSTPEPKANWAKAALIMFAITIVFFLIFGSALVAALMSVATAGGGF